MVIKKLKVVLEKNGTYLVFKGVYVMTKREALELIGEQFLAIEPYIDSMGEDIYPIIDHLIEGWGGLCILVGFTKDEAEYIVEAIMCLDYVAVAKFCEEHIGM